MTAVPAEPFESNALDPTIYVRGVAHDVFRWIRENDPVHWDEDNNLWVISKYDDISYVERKPELFCSAEGVRPAGGGGADQLSIVSMDDPEHARQRRLVSKGFTPSRINGLTTHIRELARELVDNVAARGECDFVDDIAKPLPLIVIAEMLGLNPEDRLRLAHWSDTMMSAASASLDDPLVIAAGEAWAEYVTYLVGLLEDRRANPRDDLISVLLSSADAGEIEFNHEEVTQRLTEGGASGAGLGSDDLLSFLVLLLVAGNETTRNAMSGGMLALTQFPDEKTKLAADLGLVNSATEEILRYVSPVISFSRTATADTEVRGRRIAAGDVVLNVYPSANRDDDVFEAPDEFRVDRSPNLHLAFGTGPHFCLGANLARTEIRILLEELFTRLPDIRVAPGADAERGPNSLVTTISHLPVVFTPAP